MQQTQNYRGQVMLLDNQNLQSPNNILSHTQFNDHQDISSSRPSSGKKISLNQSVHQGSKHPWTRSDELQLYRLHDKLGNKWSIIAHHMPGRTDNCVKNHFYSKLRKALRKLNKAIHDCYRKQYKEIKMNAFYKIIQANEEKHRSRAQEYLQNQDYHNGFKNRLLNFADEFDEDSLQTIQGKQVAKRMIDQVVDFNRNYKRQPKKKRKCSAHEFNLSIIYSKPKHLTAQDHISEDEDSEEIFNSGSNKQDKNNFRTMQMEPQIHFNFQVNNDFTLGGYQPGLKKQQSFDENGQLFAECIKQSSTKMDKQDEFSQQNEFYFDEHLGHGFERNTGNLFDQLINQDQNQIF